MKEKEYLFHLRPRKTKAQTSHLFCWMNDIYCRSHAFALFSLIQIVYVQITTELFFWFNSASPKYSHLHLFTLPNVFKSISMRCWLNVFKMMLFLYLIFHTWNFRWWIMCSNIESEEIHLDRITSGIGMSVWVGVACTLNLERQKREKIKLIFHLLCFLYRLKLKPWRKLHTFHTLFTLNLMSYQLTILRLHCNEMILVFFFSFESKLFGESFRFWVLRLYSE